MVPTTDAESQACLADQTASVSAFAESWNRLRVAWKPLLRVGCAAPSPFFACS